MLWQLEFPNGMRVGLKLKTFHGRGMVVSGTTPYNFKIAFSIYCIRDSTLSSLENGTCI